ncbi:MAG: PASTA domain-containing protein [Gaiellaceae bacterium]
MPPRRRRPVLWPWLLALLLLVLGGVGAAYLLTRDDEDGGTTTASPATSVELVGVPDVVGTTSSEATETLRSAGFEVNVEAVPSSEPSGQVVAQHPSAGSRAPEGSSVRINVAEEAAATTAPTTTAPPPPQPATVPDVVGQELADAARAFAEEGLKAAVRYVPSEEPEGRVVAQAQPEGTERRRGDTVQLNVSVGPEPAPETSVPNVIGAPQEQARGSLVQAGFEVLALNLAAPVRNEDRVASQSPAGGAAVPRGSLVLLYVVAG